MGRKKLADNPFKEVVTNGKEYVVFETVGKVKCEVTVDKDAWYGYLSQYSWTAISHGNRIDVKTSIDKQSNRIWRVIVEHEYDELDYWGSTIDHINNNPLDNRKENLRIFNTSILNSTNISSKFKDSDMQYIHRQGAKDKPNGYKLHFNLGGKTFYKHFSISDYGSEEATIQAAKDYRDTTVIDSRNKIIDDMIKKTRNVEFERGLRDKLRAGEHTEILEILKKYELI